MVRVESLVDEREKCEVLELDGAMTVSQVISTLMDGSEGLVIYGVITEGDTDIALTTLPLIIDDSIETYLKKHSIENLDNFRFSIITKDVFKELNDLPDSDESSDSSSDEGTDNGSEPDDDDDKSPRSPDHMEPPSGSGGNPPSSSGGAASSGDVSNPRVEDYLDLDESDLKELLKSGGLSEDDVNILLKGEVALIKKVYGHTKVLKKLLKAIEKQKREANREQTEAEARARKSAEKRAVRETIVTINASYGGQTVTVSIALGETIGELRRQIGDALKVPKGKRAKLNLSFNDIVISNNPRSSLKKFALFEGASVVVSSGLTGGGKRGADGAAKLSKDEKIHLKEIEMKTNLSTMNALNIPNIKPNVEFMVKLAMESDAETIKKALSQQPLERLRAIQSAINSTNNESSRLEAVMKVIFYDLNITIKEMDNYSRTVMETTKSVMSFLLLKTYINENVKMGWEAFRTDVEKNIEEKCRAMGATSQGLGLSSQPLR